MIVFWFVLVALAALSLVYWMAADRLSRLGAAVGRSRGPWTTARVLRWYQAAGIAAPERATARHDLAALARDGLLAAETADSSYFSTALRMSINRRQRPGSIGISCTRRSKGEE